MNISLLEKLSPVLTPGIKDSFVPASELRHGKSMARSFVECVGMLRNADYLLQLMKQIDKLVACDQHQAFLTWVSQKSRSTETNPQLATVRAFAILTWPELTCSGYL